MPRMTRNSLDASNSFTGAADQACDANVSPAVRAPTNQASVLSPQDRQELIRDVVQAVIAATANPQTVAGPPQLTQTAQLASLAPSTSLVSSTVSSTNTLPGTSIPSVPSFANTFTVSANPASALSNISPSLASCSVTTTPSTASALSSCLSSIAPVLHQPFVVGPGCSPVPAKLVTQIVSGKFVDLSELIASNLVELENDPQLFFDGRIVFTSTPKRQRRRIEDIVTWMEAFTIYALVITSYFPHRWRDLSKYQLLILRTHRQFSGRAWIGYDKAFREYAAASNLTDWSAINTQLFSYHTAGSTPRPSSATSTEGSEPKGFDGSDTICRSWNRGHCSSRFDACRFAHKCFSCSGHHRLVDCPSIFGDKRTGSQKHNSSSPPPSNTKSKFTRL